ncbi:MAG: hypothetical protein ACHQRK_04400 [Gemmatimonadales bacterium]
MRLRLLVLAMSGVVVASSACSVDSTSPLPFAAPESAGLSRGLINAPKGNDGEGDSSTFTFTIDPRRDNLLHMGAHTLYLPARAVCDPTQTSYGAAYWDTGCSPLTSNLTITARVRSASDGLPRVDFQPELRFDPRTNVLLTFAVKGKLATQAVDMRILYCATSSAKSCIDEALHDPTLQSIVDRPAKSVYRRIKHFSGYLVAE